MENIGNSLLELPLDSSGILEAVSLSTTDVDVTDTRVDNIGAMFIDESVGNNISCMDSSSMDFEFVHSDLGNSTDFDIDHPGVFGISDNGIGAREDCDDIFRDTACFHESDACVSRQNDAGTNLLSGMVSVPSFNQTNLYRDLGLKLQVIPLNNLQYVSTIQTSRGLHILAIPAQTSVSSDYDDANVQQIGQKAKECLDLDINQTLGDLMANRMQTNLDELPNLLEDMIKETELAEKTVETQQTVNISSESDNKILIKGSSLSKSRRRLRNTSDRKVVISRKNTFRKGNVRRMLNERSLMKGRKSRTLYVDVVKTPSSRKRKMVSLLKASAASKFKQVHNTCIGNKNEIKLTFHLKPSKLNTNPTYNDHAKALELFNEKAVLVSNTENCTQKEVESFGSNILCEDQDMTSETEKLQNTFVENEATRQEIPDDTQVLQDNNIKLLENPDKILEISTMSSLQKEAGNGYQCKICLSVFCRKGHFNNHLKTHSEFTSPVNVTGDMSTEKKQQEESVRQFERTIVTLKEKKDTHEKDETLLSMLNPAKNCGNETDLFKCEFCGMEFKTKGNLTRHKLTHNLDVEKEVRGRYHCDECNKYFLQKCDLKRHVATHSGTYPHVCSVCNKGFIRRSDLTVHEKFHTQEKRYKCQLCSKAYFQTGDLSRHMRQSHGDVCEFACPDCGKKYTTQKTLNLHIKSKH